MSVSRGTWPVLKNTSCFWALPLHCQPTHNSHLWGVCSQSTPILRCEGQYGLWAGPPWPQVPLLQTRKVVFRVTAVDGGSPVSEQHEGARCGHRLTPPFHALTLLRTRSKVSGPPAVSGRLLCFPPAMSNSSKERLASASAGPAGVSRFTPQPKGPSWRKWSRAPNTSAHTGLKCLIGLQQEAEVLGVNSHSDNSHLCFLSGPLHTGGEQLDDPARKSGGAVCNRGPSTTGKVQATETQSLPTGGCGCEGLRVLNIAVPGCLWSRGQQGCRLLVSQSGTWPCPRPQCCPFLRLHCTVCPYPS